MNSPEPHELYWHDGVLISCATIFTNDGYCVEIYVDLYGTLESPERRRQKMSFYDVKDFVLAIDLVTMNDNLMAGNIGDYSMAGNVNQLKPYEPDRKCLFIYFVEGYLKIEYGRMESTFLA